MEITIKDLTIVKKFPDQFFDIAFVELMNEAKIIQFRNIVLSSPYIENLCIWKFSTIKRKIRYARLKRNCNGYNLKPTIKCKCLVKCNFKLDAKMHSLDHKGHNLKNLFKHGIPCFNHQHWSNPKYVLFELLLVSKWSYDIDNITIFFKLNCTVSSNISI